MFNQPTGDEETDDDPNLRRLRRCGRCNNGQMHCQAVTEFRLNGGDAGRTYQFLCTSCGHSVQDLNRLRILHTGVIAVTSVSLSLILLGPGLWMGWSTVERGFGGNDPAAVVILLVVFLVGGLGLLAGAAWLGYQQFLDYRLRQESPEIPASDS